MAAAWNNICQPLISPSLKLSAKAPEKWMDVSFSFPLGALLAYVQEAFAFAFLSRVKQLDPNFGAKIQEFPTQMRRFTYELVQDFSQVER